jgi:hypothetical protein
MKRIALLILVAAIPAYGADDCHVVCIAKREAVDMTSWILQEQTETFSRQDIVESD